MGLRERVYRLIDEDNVAESKSNDKLSSFIMLMIVLSIIAVILESDKAISEKYHAIFYWFEVIAVILFTFEYISRIYTARLLHSDLPPGKAVRKYILSPMAVIDFLAIIPFYIELAFGLMGLHNVLDLRFIRVLRLMRLLRIFKLNRYNTSLQMIGDVLKEEKEKLYITIFMTFILLVLSSALVYTVEHESQPEAFPNIYSSMWWAIATLTTVGYGDVFPVTAMGKILAGVIALLGIGLVALPTGILSGSFVQAINEKKEREHQLLHDENVEHKHTCPHCNKEFISDKVD